MRISKKARLIMLVAMAFVVIFALSALAGCKKTPVGGYYLSVYDNGSWTNYTSVNDVPATHKFVQDTANEDVYKLTIDLEQGVSVKIAQVGSDTVYGGAELFGSSELKAGSDNAIVVEKSGKYELSLNVADKEISFSFTAKQTPTTCGKPGCTCGDSCTGNDCTCGNTDAPEALLVEIDGVSGPVSLTYPTGTTLTATVTFDDESTSHDGIQWESSNTNVATVANGVVTVKTAGTTQIKAKYGDIESTPLTVNVNGTATLTESSKTLNVNGEWKIGVELQGGATIYQYRSSDTKEEVIKIDQEGNVTAVGAGTATVTIDWYMRPGTTGTPGTLGMSLQCTITVSTPVEDMTVPGAITVGVDGDQDLTVTFVPANASNQNYTYVVTQDADPVISVEKNGTTLKIHGIKEGTATITVTSEEGSIVKSCTVTVADASSEYANDIDPSTLTIDLNDTGRLTVSGNGIASVTWSTSNDKIVAVNANTDDNKIANIAGAGYGTATITASITFVSGGSDTKTATIMVSPTQMWVYGAITDGGWNAAADTYDKAVESNLTLTGSNGIFTGTVHLIANSQFRIAHSNYDWKGFRWEHISSVAGEKDNAVQGDSDGNGGRNVKVTVAGYYTITVDLTNGKPVLKIHAESIDVTSVSVTTDQSTLTSEGDITVAIVTLTINPSSATYTTEDIEWKVSNDSLVDMVIAENYLSVTITVKGGLTEGGTVEVSVKVKEAKASVNITIVQAGGETVGVTSIEFEQSAYTWNINDNGSFNGAGLVVKANVNEDATNQGVIYSASYSDDILKVDSATGEVIAKQIGTYTITATAAGDESKTTTCTVTFYSDMFYIVSGVSSWTATDSNTTAGTAFENFTFKANDDTYQVFTLDVAISTASTTFQIMFIGSGANWDYAITGANATLSGLTANGNNIVTGSVGLYTITLDISGTKPTVSATTKDIPTYTSSLMKDGEADAVVTSGNSSVVSNRYSMTLESTFEADAVYTIKVGDNTLTINSISGNTGDDVTYFTLADSKLTCVTAGKYRLTVLYNPADDSCIVSVEKIAAGWVEDKSGTYGITASAGTNWGSGTWTNTVLDVKVYYNSEEGAYEVYFSFTIPSDANFCFGLTIGGEWKHDIKGGAPTTTNGSSHMGAGSGNYWASNGGGLTYFKLEFTVSGGAVTLTALTTSDTDTLNTRG